MGPGAGPVPGAGRGPVARVTRARLRGRRTVAVVALVGLTAAVAVAARSGPDTTPERLAQRFAAAWSRGDYRAMYNDIDITSQRAYSLERFAAAYRDSDATATTLAGGRTAARARPGPGATVAVATRVQTRAFGAVAGAFSLPVRGHGSGARIVWSPWLSFPGVREGEVLRRRTVLAPRAQLLARDDTVLATGPAAPGGGQRRSALPAAAPIVGVLGPIPSADARRRRALGYPPGARVGIDGLELTFEERLAGMPGGELRAGRRVLAASNPRPGSAVHTTIGPALQSVAVSALGTRLGAVVALTPATGEILALAGIPLSGLQPPGSTFKMITATAALEAHLATLSTRFADQTQATLSGVTLRNANGESCGGTLLQAFASSCNSVFAPLGARVGGARLVDTAHRFGFGEPPGIPGAATSTLPAAGRIGDDLAVGSTAIGQGEVQASALEMALVAATIGMGGQRPRPTLALGGGRAPVRATSPLVARMVGRMMLAVVRQGTGQAAAIPGVRVAGKTGTAELHSSTCTPADTTAPAGSSSCAGASDPTNTDAWFAAYAPAGHPRIAVAVLLVGDGAGGDTAAPVARQVLQGAVGQRAR